MATQNEQLRINEWISSEGKNFSYKIYWPYQGRPLEKDELVDTFVRPNINKKQAYVGTFTTLKDLGRVLRRFQENGERANGTYLPLASDNMILLRSITHSNIETTIADLIQKEQLFKYFSKEE